MPSPPLVAPLNTSCPVIRRCAVTSSPGWTRTTNPSVNSRMLCQLSYRGITGVHANSGADRWTTLAYRHTRAQLQASLRTGADRVGTHAPGRVRQDGPIRTVVGRDALIRYVVVLGLGYVLGSKAGRRRYEQIAATYRALTSSPLAQSMIEGGRRKIANRVSPDAGFVTVAEIDNETAVVRRGAERPTDDALTPSDRRR
jgi:hypothetical protein